MRAAIVERTTGRLRRAKRDNAFVSKQLMGTSCNDDSASERVFRDSGFRLCTTSAGGRDRRAVPTPIVVRMTMGDMVSFKRITKRRERKQSEQQAEGNRSLCIARERNLLDQHHIGGDTL
jgi:hypothetical protein